MLRTKGAKKTEEGPQIILLKDKQGGEKREFTPVFPKRGREAGGNNRKKKKKVKSAAPARDQGERKRWIVFPKKKRDSKISTGNQKEIVPS